eukprot:328157-Pelagomonas_calceolata.AAC.1
MIQNRGGMNFKLHAISRGKGLGTAFQAPLQQAAAKEQRKLQGSGGCGGEEEEEGLSLIHI